MNEFRAIKKKISGKNATDGAGVKLVRVFGFHDTKDFDPFLMLDAFDSMNPMDYTKGFPWHPHRGIETITYLVQGDIEHGDSLGNKGSILSGDCQWMTAGSGIIHQEMPKESDRMLGVQLWLNLPSADKMTAPKYRQISNADIPMFETNDYKVHVIAGNYMGLEGAAQGEHVKANFLDLELKPATEWILETEEKDNVFAYILQGKIQIEGQEVEEKHAVLFDHGQRLRISSAEGGARLLLLSGKPLEEPVAWGGPIVMNTQEQLEQAFKELEQGIFVK